ncbi:MAG TPA: MucR family transcriptional regulator [Allosphingosinicella sp.]|jgi:predicted transcriptional regulator
MDAIRLVELTADIVAAHVANNRVTVEDMPNLVTRVHDALAGLGAPPAEPPQEEARPKPAVSIRASVKPDHLVCLACGRKQKTLKRHLATAHGLDPQQYRAEFGLPSGYPMVAADYAKQRREMAHAIGLGRKGGGPRGGRGKPAAKAAPTGRSRRGK